MSSKSQRLFESSKGGCGQVKLSILDYYLGSYFARSCQTQSCDSQVIYVDGFAGPGKYILEDGSEEDGSPLIALKKLFDHKLFKNFSKPVLMIFIEPNEQYYEELEKNLKLYIQKDEQKVLIKTLKCEFQFAMDQILEDYQGTMFVFADPFGIKAVPMSIIKRIVERPMTELLLNVRYNSVNRFISAQKHKPNIEKFLGIQIAGQVRQELFSSDGNKFNRFIEYYGRSLCASDSKEMPIYRHIFSMRDQRNRGIYHLLFVTKCFESLIAMKRSLINNSQNSQTFEYSEWISANPDRSPRKLTDQEITEDLIERIKSRFRNEKVLGKKIERFIWEETPYKLNQKVKLKKLLPKAQPVPKRSKFNEILFEFQ